MDELCVIYPEGKRWWIYVCLRTALNHQLSRPPSRWRVRCQRLLDNTAHLSIGESLQPLHINLISHRHHFINSLSGKCGNEKDGCVIDKFKTRPDSIYPDGGILIRNQVPFIDNERNALECLLDVAGYMCILGCDQFGGIQHQQGNITPVDGAQ